MSSPNPFSGNPKTRRFDSLWTTFILGGTFRCSAYREYRQSHAVNIDTFYLIYQLRCLYSSRLRAMVVSESGADLRGVSQAKVALK